MLSESFNPQWKNYFNGAGLCSFDDFWALQLDPVDQPNQRGKGYSSVSCFELAGDPVAKNFYLKRQYRYRGLTLAHPFLGLPLTVREFNNIQLLQQLNISALDWAYHGYDTETSRSILITPELTGYQPLDQLYPGQDNGSDGHDKGRQALQSSARLIARLHDHQLQHRALYPHHVFVDALSSSACFIDLEGVFKNPLGRMQIRVSDLSTFLRRGALSAADQALFMDTYSDASQRPFNRASLTERVNRRMLRKRKRKRKREREQQKRLATAQGG